MWISRIKGLETFAWDTLPFDGSYPCFRDSVQNGIALLRDMHCRQQNRFPVVSTEMDLSLLSELTEFLKEPETSLMSTQKQCHQGDI